MKWFIASDIHGSEYYCKKMLEAFEREAGDVASQSIRIIHCSSFLNCTARQ